MRRPSNSTVRTVALAVAIATAVAASGCGQRGPLTLPESARPIERLPQQPATPAAPQNDEEEQRNER